MFKCECEYKKLIKYLFFDKNIFTNNCYFINYSSFVTLFCPSSENDPLLLLVQFIL